nr:integrase, catalytic region, zinc finger, CCHC-type, peptidase aspartic, catalytic [Tanacetum cinerariifolium]
MLNDVHARTKKPNKPHSYFRVLYENTSKAWKWWIERQSPSGYKWVPKPKKKWVPKAKMQWVPKAKNDQIVQLILFIVDSVCTKHMTGNLKLLCNFVEKFLRTVRFGNDQFTPILGYGDLVQGNITINRFYYVEGLNHNLFSVGQFCDADLEVAFRKSTCFVRDLQGHTNSSMVMASKAFSSQLRLYQLAFKEGYHDWPTKVENCTAMSSAEAEYVALSASCAKVMWMRTQLQDYGFNYNRIPLYCDSQSAIAISCNPNRRDLPKDTPQLEIAVLRYDGDECGKGIMQTKTELTLE